VATASASIRRDSPGASSTSIRDTSAASRLPGSGAVSTVTEHASNPGSCANAARPTAVHRHPAVHRKIGDVEGEDLAGAGGGLIQQPPQGLLPQRVVGVEEGEQLGRGDGSGAGVRGRSDRGRRRSGR
jgi:hypothetical protein